MKPIMLLVVVVVFWQGSISARAKAQGTDNRGISLEGRSLRVMAIPGQPDIALGFKSGERANSAEIALVPAGGAQSVAIGKAEIVEDAAGERSFRVTAGTAQAEITLGTGPFVKVTPGKQAASIEIKADARYAALPDFFADDVVFDPAKFKGHALGVPADNFLLQFVEGGNTIVMCIWPGNLKLPTRGGAAAPSGKVVKEGAEPRVDLVFSGDGKGRRISAVRIEFRDKPVYVGMLQGKGIWHDEEVSNLPAYRPVPIAWKRPCEARWRGDFLVAEGKTMHDWPTRHQSFDFQSTSTARVDRWWERGADAMDARFAAATSNARPEKWWERGDENAPQIWQESLASFFIYPAVLKGEEVRLCLYADKATRGKKRLPGQATGQAAQNTSDAGPPNVYERVIIYPLGRVRTTPLDVYTPVDLMRETLGTGPCEYVLDLAGVKPQLAGGDRPILSYATCGLWNDHILPITRQFKSKPGGEFEPLDEKTKAHLIQALEEMWYFVHAVHDRLREYRKWGADMAAYCARESARSPAAKPLAEKALLHIRRLNDDVGRHRFDGPGSEAYWQVRIPALIAMVKQDRYAEVATIGKIRDLGNEQDERVSRCRQYVKALRQEILFEDAGNADTRTLAAEIRDRCHQMLRHMHPKEGF
jgi:hypothetical protein